MERVTKVFGFSVNWRIDIHQSDLPSDVKVVLSDLLSNHGNESNLCEATEYSINLMRQYVCDGFFVERDFYEVLIFEPNDQPGEKFFTLIKGFYPGRTYSFKEEGLNKRIEKSYMGDQRFWREHVVGKMKDSIKGFLSCATKEQRFEENLKMLDKFVDRDQDTAGLKSDLGEMYKEIESKTVGLWLLPKIQKVIDSL